MSDPNLAGIIVYAPVINGTLALSVSAFKELIPQELGASFKNIPGVFN